MASARTTWSFGGRAALVALFFIAAATFVFDHPLPALAFGLVALLLLASLPGRAPLDRLELLPLPPAWLVEDETRLLEAPYRLPGVRAPFALRLASRGPEVEFAAASPLLNPAALGRLPVRVTALRRGHHSRIALECTVQGPFGWRPCGRTFELAVDFWVLPRPRALRERVLEEMLALRPRGLDLPQPTGPGEGEFYALKHFRPGDPERRVHARLSARLGKKVLRIFRGEAPPLVHLLVDPRVGRSGRAFGGGDFDEAMRFAAGMVRALLLRNVPVALSIVEAGGTRLAVAESCRDLYTYLATLALARPFASEGGATLPDFAAGARGERRVVLHLGMVDESRIPPDCLAIQAGSQRYFQLLDMEMRAAPKGVEHVA
jgi:uncharacterized protein (DUF58 family)